ncbi:MAG: HD domain-containing protein, partial [Chloroflexi bacterium]|nr:HD domain-containing protein [Chloroflexota bacterium]
MIPLTDDYLQRLLQTFLTLRTAKEYWREGEIYWGVKRPDADSVAAHTCCVAQIALLLADEVREAKPGLKLDIDKVVKIPLIRHMPKSITGDTSYAVRIMAEEEFRLLEVEAFNLLTRDLSISCRDEWQELFQEYTSLRGGNSLTSTEARIALFADGLDAWMQALSFSHTWMPAHEEYNKRVYESLKGDSNLHDGLAQLFRQASTMLKGRQIGPKRPHGDIVGIDVRAFLQNLSDRLAARFQPASSQVMQKIQLLKLLQTYLTLQSAKELGRKGYIYFGFKRAESDSIAAHMCCVAWIALYLAEELNRLDASLKLNVGRAISIGLVHDMPEAITGDIGFAVKLIDKNNLQSLEEKGFNRLIENLCPSSQKRLLDLLGDYNSCNSTEARVALFADGLDAWMQVLSVPYTWMPAHEEYNKLVYEKLKG